MEATPNLGQRPMHLKEPAIFLICVVVMEVGGGVFCFVWVGWFGFCYSLKTQSHLSQPDLRHPIWVKI